MSSWRTAFGMLLLTALLGVAFRYSGLPAPLEPRSAGARFLNSWIYETGDLDYRLIGHSISEVARLGASAPEYRELDARIWFPSVEEGAVAPGRHPLLLINHGLSSSKYEDAYLAAFLARHGYIVVSVDFPAAGLVTPGGATAEEVVHQPGDVSSMIDALLHWDGEPDSQFYQAIDHTRIGVIGVSLGGVTSTLLAYHPLWRDERVKLVVSIAGPLALLPGHGFYGAGVPLMMIASRADVVVDYARNSRHLLSAIPDSTLVTIDNASHAGFSGLSRYFRWLPNPDVVSCARYRHDDSLARLRSVWSNDAGNGHADPDAAVEPQGCDKALPAAINPVRQQWITMLSVYSFVQQQFAETRAEIAAASDYLYESMPDEFPGIVEVVAVN